MKINEIEPNYFQASALSESQVFDFEKYKPDIIKYIQRIKNGSPNNLVDTALFYNIITNRPAVGAAQKSNITIDPQAWKKYFSQPHFSTDGAWSQRDFNFHLKSSQNNLNFYLTIEKSNKNIINFIQNLNKLDSALNKLANDTQSRISYKTHPILDTFVDHNDSLKIFYNNPKLKSQIEQVAKSWAQSQGIVLSNRSHEHGLDTDKSFGDRLALSVEKAFRATIEKNRDQYTDEQYYQWIVKYLPSMIKNGKDTINEIAPIELSKRPAVNLQDYRSEVSRAHTKSSIGKLDIYFIKEKSDPLIIGMMDDKVVFAVNLDLAERPNVYSVEMSSMGQKYQGFGAMPRIYAAVLRDNPDIVLRAGSAQSPGGQSIWDQLASQPGIQVFAKKSGSSDMIDLEYDQGMGQLHSHELDAADVDLYDKAAGYRVYAAAKR
jgi:hypothetical protein